MTRFPRALLSVNTHNYRDTFPLAPVIAAILTVGCYSALATILIVSTVMRRTPHTGPSWAGTAPDNSGAFLILTFFVVCPTVMGTDGSHRPTLFVSAQRGPL